MADLDASVNDRERDSAALRWGLALFNCAVFVGPAHG
jgi:hypothetical protein